MKSRYSRDDFFKNRKSNIVQCFFCFAMAIFYAWVFMKWKYVNQA